MEKRRDRLSWKIEFKQFAERFTRFIETILIQILDKHMAHKPQKRGSFISVCEVGAICPLALNEENVALSALDLKHPVGSAGLINPRVVAVRRRAVGLEWPNGKGVRRID
jgi:hypothetical protein